MYFKTCMTFFPPWKTKGICSYPNLTRSVRFDVNNVKLHWFSLCLVASCAVPNLNMLMRFSFYIQDAIREWYGLGTTWGRVNDGRIFILKPCISYQTLLWLCSWLVMLISAVNVPVDECESTQLFWSLLCAQASTCVCVCISLRDVSGCVGRCLIAQMGLLLLVFGLSRSDAVEQKHSPRVQIHYPPLDLHLRLSLMLNCRQKPWPGVNTHALTHWAAVFIRFMSVFLIFCSFSSVNNITIILSFILG